MTIKDIHVPDIGDFSEVEVIEVLVKPGDTVAKEGSLITVESDKASMEIPSSDPGIVKEMKVALGDKVSEGDVIVSLEVSDELSSTESLMASEAPTGEGLIASPSRTAPFREEPPIGPQPVSEPSKPALRATESLQPQTKPLESGVRRSPTAHFDQERFKKAHASPSVRRFARELGADLGVVKGTGPKGRILKHDVQVYIKQALTSGATGFSVAELPEVDFSKFGTIELKPLTRINKLTGQNLHRNWVRIPHVTQYDEADITELEAFRNSLNEEYKDRGTKITIIVFLMKAVVSALKAFPRFNSSLDRAQENLVIKHYYHIGVAVDTKDGLVVPVIRDVDRKSLVEIAAELTVVSAKAREGKLSPAEMQGGCFSISSLGGIGGTAFTPIVNAPEVAVLGVSKATTKPVFQNKAFVPRLILPFSLSYDHRVIDGADGVRFTKFLSAMLSDTRRMLL
jgi:pyruvate dehydrogenase E2 component (dihydrolipoyllysine-residue acetyltransferase)